MQLDTNGSSVIITHVAPCAIHKKSNLPGIRTEPASLTNCLRFLAVADQITVLCRAWGGLVLHIGPLSDRKLSLKENFVPNSSGELWVVNANECCVGPRLISPGSPPWMRASRRTNLRWWGHLPRTLRSKS